MSYVTLLLNVMKIFILVLTFFISQDKVTCLISDMQCMFIDNVSSQEDIKANGSSNREALCKKTDVCLTEFNITYIKHEPYYSLCPIETLLEQCCGKCTKFKIINRFDNLSNLRPELIKTSHFIYPILGRTRSKRLYGYHFVPYLEAPPLYYVTERNEITIGQVIKKCLALYPLILICIFMSVISGFLAWIMETWFNREEFPRPFLLGWFEGFWWSFVSMTTVGYGDKTPKSPPARIFSVIWILIGIITFNIITASLLTEISGAAVEPVPTITGARVGALRSKTYEAYIVAAEGGTYHPTHASEFFSGIVEMTQKLIDKKIDGFLLDTLAYWYFSKFLENYNGNEEFRKTFKHFRKTKVDNVGENLSYGILVQDKRDYDYFHDVIVDNGIVKETKLALEWNREDRSRDNHEEFSSSFDGLLELSLKITGVMIALICFFGLVYETGRRKDKFKLFFNKDYNLD